MQIRGANLRIYHQDPAELEAQIDVLAAMGCTHLSIVVSHYMRVEYNAATKDNEIAFAPAGMGITDKGGTPWLIFPDIGAPIGPYANTPSPDLVYHAASYAQKRGLVVMLKPHVDLLRVDGGRWQPAGWRGFAVLPRRLAHDFVWGYTYRFVAHYVAIAAELGAGLVFGTELYSISKSYGADIWLRIVEIIRGALAFKGRLTYSANGLPWGDEAEWVRLHDLWTECDYVGVSAYFPLPSLDWHYKPFDWHPPLDDWLTTFAAQVGKPLLFTEWGAPNRADANLDPMRDPLPTDVADGAMQLQLAKAMTARWSGDPAFAGYFVWEAWRNSGQEITHEVKPDTEFAAVLFGDKP